MADMSESQGAVSGAPMEGMKHNIVIDREFIFY